VETKLLRLLWNRNRKGRDHGGRPRKRWLDMVEGNHKVIEVREWKGIVQYREAWRNIVMAATNLGEL